MKSLLILWLFISCFTDSTKYSGSLKNLLIKYHNDARTAVRNGQARGRSGNLPKPKSMPSLRWSDRIAWTASRYADSCEGAVTSSGRSTCLHSTQAKKNGRNWWDRNGLAAERGGENIGCPWNGGVMDEFKLKSWVKDQMIDGELRKYAYEDTSFGSSGHYTQIIWAKTTQFGCGYSKCSSGYILVCHYRPFGNYRGQKPYEKSSGGSGGGSGGWDGNWGFDMFQAGDLESSCFENYDKTLHFYANKTSAPSHVFERDDSMGCPHDEPFYRYEDAMLYYSGASEAIQWVIDTTQHEAGRRFICSKVNLYECTKGSWSSVYYDQYEDDMDHVYSPSVNGSVGPPLSNEERYLAMADAEIKTVSPNNAGTDDSGVAIVVIIICIVFAILILFGSWYFIRYRNKQKMNVKQLEIPNDDEEEQEEAEEVEVTVPITAAS